MEDVCCLTRTPGRRSPYVMRRWTPLRRQRLVRRRAPGAGTTDSPVPVEQRSPHVPADRRASLSAAVPDRRRPRRRGLGGDVPLLLPLPARGRPAVLVLQLDALPGGHPGLRRAHLGDPLHRDRGEHGPAVLLPDDHGDRVPDRQRAGVHHGQPGDSTEAERAAARRLPGAGRPLLRELGPALRRVAAADRGPDRRDRGRRGAASSASSTTSRGGHWQSRGFASNHYLRENFHRCIDLYSKMWHHHTEFLMLGYGAYVVFFEFCKPGVPGDRRPDRRPDGRRHGRHHVPPGRRAEEARRAGGRARPRRPVRRGQRAGQGAQRAGRAGGRRRALAGGARGGEGSVVQRLGR